MKLSILLLFISFNRREGIIVRHYVSIYYWLLFLLLLLVIVIIRIARQASDNFVFFF